MAGRDRRGLNEKPDVLNHGVGVGLGEHVVGNGTERPAGTPPPHEGRARCPLFFAFNGVGRRGGRGSSSCQAQALGSIMFAKCEGSSWLRIAVGL